MICGNVKLVVWARASFVCSCNEVVCFSYFSLLFLDLLDIYGRKSTAELWVHIPHPQVRADTENGQRSGVN